MSRRLPADFFDQPTATVARQLLGCELVRTLSDGRLARGIVVETEAYLADQDAACHAARGITKSNQSMFHRAGTLYVYPIHSRYCMNVVTGPVGQGSAVLLRACEFTDPKILVDLIDNRLGKCDSQLPDKSPRELSRWLSSGPGRLCDALKINRQHDGLDLLTSSEVWIETQRRDRRLDAKRIRQGCRIGLTKAADLRLRWFLDGHLLVSGPASAHSQGRSWRYADTDPFAS